MSRWGLRIFSLEEFPTRVSIDVLLLILVIVKFCQVVNLMLLNGTATVCWLCRYFGCDHKRVGTLNIIKQIKTSHRANMP